MVNTNIQGPVPLSGRGFIARRHGDYQPGEFKQLNNCYIDEKGSIQNRNNFFCLRDNVNNVEEILGTYENFNVIHSFAAQYINNKFQGPWNLLWSDTNLPAATGTNPGKRLLGFFKYNDGIYWLSVKMNTNASSKITTWKFYLHYKLNYVPTNPSLPLTEVESSYLNKKIIRF